MCEVALQPPEQNNNCLVFFNLVQLLKDLTEHQIDLDKIMHTKSSSLGSFPPPAFWGGHLQPLLSASGRLWDPFLFEPSFDPVDSCHREA